MASTPKVSKQEADQRRDEIALRMLTSPPKRHDEMKIGKGRTKRGKSPAKRNPVEK